MSGTKIALSNLCKLHSNGGALMKRSFFVSLTQIFFLLFTSSIVFAAPLPSDCDEVVNNSMTFERFQQVLDNSADYTGDSIIKICLQDGIQISSGPTLRGLRIQKNNTFLYANPQSGVFFVAWSYLIGGNKLFYLDNVVNFAMSNLIITGHDSNTAIYSEQSHISRINNVQFNIYGGSGVGINLSGGKLSTLTNSKFELCRPGDTCGAMYGIYATEALITSIRDVQFHNGARYSRAIMSYKSHIKNISGFSIIGYGSGISAQFSQIDRIRRGEIRLSSYYNMLNTPPNSFKNSKIKNVEKLLITVSGGNWAGLYLEGQTQVSAIRHLEITALNGILADSEVTVRKLSNFCYFGQGAALSVEDADILPTQGCVSLYRLQ